MNTSTPNNNPKIPVALRLGGYILIAIITYYLIVEHTAHLIEYGGIFAFFLIVLFLIIVRFGIMNWKVPEKPPEG